jgi:hypothetical protein
MRRRQAAPLPKSPFSYGETVKFRTCDGADHVGVITLVGWLPFPGMWSFEIKTNDGITHKAPGDVKEIDHAETAAPAEAPHFEKTPAGDQAVIPGAEGRSIPDAKLKPRKRQRDSLTPLESGWADDKQQSLF